MRPYLGHGLSSRGLRVLISMTHTPVKCSRELLKRGRGREEEKSEQGQEKSTGHTRCCGLSCPRLFSVITLK